MGESKQEGNRATGGGTVDPPRGGLGNDPGMRSVNRGGTMVIAGNPRFVLGRAYGTRTKQARRSFARRRGLLWGSWRGRNDG